MLCLPISILILASINYSCFKTSLKLRLLTMSEEEKIEEEEEALHSLFKLADEDNSGNVDSAELADILKALGWKVTIKSAHELLEKICKSTCHATHQKHMYQLSERQFIDAMLSGIMKRMYEEKKRKFLDKMKKKKKQRKKPKLVASDVKMNRKEKHIVKKKQMLLKDRSELIRWTLRKNYVANSLSGATQLLLLSHTPVSRKVFQFFDCNHIAGRSLLRADYNVNCNSKNYYTFLPLVIIVLMLFVAALPGTISLYLWKNRKHLYSTTVYQKIGWLYDPFVRGAEFWQVHDLMVKMVLTGMLIYVPPTSRAGLATLVCVIACCNLNYFQPQKNKILFWLTQISFVVKITKKIFLFSSSFFYFLLSLTTLKKLLPYSFFLLNCK